MLLSSLCPLPPPPKKKIQKICERCFSVGHFCKHSRCSLLSSLCPPRPAPYPSACHFSTLTQEISKTILSRADAREDQSETALPVTLPRKTDRVSRGRRHPTTAESWIALPATLPRKDKVSRGRGNILLLLRFGLHCLRPSQERRTGFQEDWGILLLPRVGLHCLWPSQERRTGFQEDRGILLLQRVGLHCLRHSQERRTGFQEDGGHPTTAESWITLPATLPRKLTRFQEDGGILLLQIWIALPATLPRKTDRVSRGLRTSYYCRELDCIACDPPKKGQGFKRTGTSYYAEGWITLPAALPRKTDRVSRGRGHPTTAESWRALCPADQLGALPTHKLHDNPTPSTMMTHIQLHDNPHPAPWWPTSSSPTTHTQLHNGPDLRHTPDELRPAGCRCGSTGGNYNLYIGT